MQKTLEIIPEETISVNEGRHNGTITDLIKREHKALGGEEYTYLDVIIRIDGENLPDDFTIKWGAPYKVTEQTKLGKFVQLFMDWKVGGKLDLVTLLKNKKVNFTTSNSPEPGKGTFARIADDSFKVGYTKDRGGE